MTASLPSKGDIDRIAAMLPVADGALVRAWLEVLSEPGHADRRPSSRERARADKRVAFINARAKLAAGLRLRPAAELLAECLATYLNSAYRRHRELGAPPAGSSEQDRALYAVAEATDARPLRYRRIMEILR